MPHFPFFCMPKSANLNVKIKNSKRVNITLMEMKSTIFEIKKIWNRMDIKLDTTVGNMFQKIQQEKLYKIEYTK